MSRSHDAQRKAHLGTYLTTNCCISTPQIMLNACLPSETNTMCTCFSDQHNMHLHMPSLLFNIYLKCCRPLLPCMILAVVPNVALQVPSCHRQAVCTPGSYHTGSVSQVQQIQAAKSVGLSQILVKNMMCGSDVCPPDHLCVVCQHLLLRYIMSAQIIIP